MPEEIRSVFPDTRLGIKIFIKFLSVLKDAVTVKLLGTLAVLLLVLYYRHIWVGLYRKESQFPRDADKGRGTGK